MSQVYNPVSTYRIQFNKEFTFSDFRKIIPYLEKLGIKTIYASPVFEATPGSMHGYDGTDPNKINPEIGIIDQLLEIATELKQRNIGWIQDIVPNHLSYHENTKWLVDVLAKGKNSEYASVFDIIWDHPHYPDRLMVPFPGSSLEQHLRENFPGEKNYVLCSWQETDHRMNYRRFFLVNTLICTNVHDDKVFELYHQLVRDLVKKDVFQGLRVDHIDGLYDPTQYLEDLRKLSGESAYIIIEKILEAGEQMPEYWPVQGNSGYDFLGIINNLFTNQQAEYALTTFYYDVTRDSTPVEKQIHNKKEMILSKYMGGELDNLTRLYREVSGKSDTDISDDMLKQHIADYLVNCPVYRYYEDIPVMQIDKDADPVQMRKFYQRCMQFTGPLMAKGVEDTLMYTYNRFIGHNEVGDSPEFFGYKTEQFHLMMQYRQQKWPLAMNSSSTHDTKRGEDVRARLNVLTDLHDEWLKLVRQFQILNEALRKDGMPDKNDEYFIYQTLAGSYPVYSPSGFRVIDTYPKRLKEYLEKALREAKVHSTWTEQNKEYEEATVDFATKIADPDGAFFKSFFPFLKKITDYGMINSFSQVLLKCTCPGIPDVYQGTELWDLSLVDPDNRRPVDYTSREEMMMEHAALQELWKTRWDGRIKLELLHRVLRFRNEHAEIFSHGEYIPLKATGTYQHNLVCFLRKSSSGVVLVAVPLNYSAVKEYSEYDLLVADWKDTGIQVPPGTSRLKDGLNGKTIETDGSLLINDLFKGFPGGVWYADNI